MTEPMDPARRYLSAILHRACSTALAPRLAALEQPHAVSGEGFVEAASALGGTFFGAGHHRVLTGEPLTRYVDTFRIATLDRDDDRDRALIEAFVAGCSDDDRDEAELTLDELDPAITVLIDEHGSIASHASARPWEVDPEFARRRRREGRLLFYNCDVDNTGSNRVAEAVGFELVCTVAAASFD